MKRLVFIILFFLLLIPKNYSAPVKLGIDNLIESNFELLKGKRVGLLTNNTGRTSSLELTANVLSESSECNLTAVFTPEHGFYTTIPAGHKVSDDKLFGVPMYSLYGSNRRPTKEQLMKCDIIVTDIQDIGIRSYTYISTVYKMMDACAEYNVPIIILDRPNPLGGTVVDGNILKKGYESFLGVVPVSYIHGCTIAELAVMINKEGWLPADKKGAARQCDLTVVKMSNWQRWMVWESTGLQWIPTSPHIPSVDAVRGAAMLGIFGELGTIQIGIGTTLPFQYIGLPNMNVKTVAANLKSLSFPGVDLLIAKFRPFYGLFNGKDLDGFLLRFNSNTHFKPYSTGIEIMLSVRKVFPELFPREGIKDSKRSLFIKATGTDEIYNAFLKRATDGYILSLSQKGLEDYLQTRSKYLLY